MRIRDIKIGTRLKAAFGMMTLTTLLIGGFGIYQTSEMFGYTKRLYDHPYTVSNSLRDIRGNIRQVEAVLAALAPGASQAQAVQANNEIQAAQKEIQELFALVTQRFLGAKEDVMAAERSFDEWCVLLDAAIYSFTSDQGEDRQRAAVMAARQHTGTIIRKTQVMIDFATKKASDFLANANDQARNASMVMTFIAFVAAMLGLFVALRIARGITSPLHAIVRRIQAISTGDLGQELDYASKDEVGELADAFRVMRQTLKERIQVADAIASGDYGQKVELAGDLDALGKSLERMTEALRDAAKANADSDWIKSGRNSLAALLAGEHELRSLGSEIIRFLCTYLNAQVGTFYVMTPEKKLILAGSYAFTKRKGISDSYAVGQGLVGQAALEHDIISLTEIPEDYIRINSSLGETQPRNVLLLPILHEGEVKGVLELGSFAEFTDVQLDYLRNAAESIAIALHSVESQTKLRTLLEQTQKQAEELQAQQEELRVSNEELEQQALALRSSEEQLRQQQEELEATNEELKEKTAYLERQRAEMAMQNIDLDNTRKGLEIKARELEVTTRYKSEFLANMSHELRTPLNSLLLLSRNLMENGKGNLEAEQVDFATIIHRSGNDLLTLINEILDLSKIEAGKMTILPETFPVADLAEGLVGSFKPLTDEKGLHLTVRVDESLPPAVHTDRHRLEQILRNLLSNAVKFCDKGGITLSFNRAEPGDCSGLAFRPEDLFVISVADTGVGIPEDKQFEIFEAFRQVDGGTSRRYGGTGLGLTISRELARLLGGVVKVASVPGEGSTFSLIIPLKLDTAAGRNDASDEPEPARDKQPVIQPASGSGGQTLSSGGDAVPSVPRPSSGPRLPGLADDRGSIPPEGGFILIVEDDLNFAKILLDQCRAKGFAALHAVTGEEGLELARTYPVGGMVLDIRLPGMSGWQVLDTLKHDPALRHIPVHIMSAVEGSLDALKKGAVGFLSKPASREDLDSALGQLEGVMSKKVKDLLLVEDNEDMLKGLSGLLADANVNIHEAVNGSQALAALRERRFDCMILDLGLPDMTGFELLDRLGGEDGVHIPPVIVYTGRELTRDEERDLRGHADSIIIKGVKSEERLIDETALFLHQMVKTLPPRKQELIANLYDKDKALRGKTVLLVDDDMRNLYALAHVLSEKGLNVLKAEDGKKALEVLEERQDVDLVLLDIMMPVMDGYETLARIRSVSRLAQLPVIALTAKAMREDKEKCMSAGASDYISKPVDLDRLLSVLRVWLYKK